MNRQAALKALHKMEPLAATIESSRPGYGAWVGVYPLNLSDPMTVSLMRRFGLLPLPTIGRVYRIRAIEVELKLIEADVWFGEESITSRADLLAIGDDELFQRLAELGVGPDQLEQHYKSDYPI
jgi:hypothetical protein